MSRHLKEMRKEPAMKSWGKSSGNSKLKGPEVYLKNSKGGRAVVLRAY